MRVELGPRVVAVRVVVVRVLIDREDLEPLRQPAASAQLHEGR
jgi:hypothetical protein